MSIFVMR